MKRYSYLVPAVVESLLGLAALVATAVILFGTFAGGPR